jgi:hypothetical protein
MSLKPAIDVQTPVGDKWDVPHSVRIRSKLETITALNGILSQRETMEEYAAIALANVIFHLDSGRVRVNGGWAYWSRIEDKDQIRLDFLNDSKKEGN